ncbi:type IVB secretion system protein IcmH/DotU, partial [Mesorhizobium sp. M8A.F.Ca.ET.167.01.1.1]|uniref:type IVB secretion system protein IcmH/DotU n=1 Tax=Mesorhizobium sp. M8A.F.Ca.ET.167.01.1.1 TaxID=2563961 RepID=UPI001FDF89A3
MAPENPEVLRTRLLDALLRARDAAMAAGSALERADQAAWAVAALLDDLALNTPWGGASAWPRQPLVVMLRGDVDAGTQFFTRLDELERHPNRDREMLELQYYCLALGFRGKYRVPGRAGDRS